jgi:DNA-binding response OmpR family regulator
MLETSPCNKAKQSLKILVVEDEVMVGLLTEEFLDALGHTAIGPIARLEKAVEAAQNESVDLALLDINLAGQEVFPVADILRKRSIPFIFLSGYGDSRLRPCDEGKPILQKPYLKEQLQTAISTIFPA